MFARHIPVLALVSLFTNPVTAYVSVGLAEP